MKPKPITPARDWLKELAEQKGSLVTITKATAQGILDALAATEAYAAKCVDELNTAAENWRRENDRATAAESRAQAAEGALHLLRERHAATLVLVEAAEREVERLRACRVCGARGPSAMCDCENYTKGYRAGVEAAANLHETIAPFCQHEPSIGAGAMGAVIQYRDAIRALAPEPAAPAHGPCPGCAKGEVPLLLDEHGTFSHVSGLPGRLGHAVDDFWWFCDAYTKPAAPASVSECGCPVDDDVDVEGEEEALRKAGTPAAPEDAGGEK